MIPGKALPRLAYSDPAAIHHVILMNYLTER